MKEWRHPIEEMMRKHVKVYVVTGAEEWWRHPAAYDWLKLLAVRVKGRLHAELSLQVGWWKGGVELCRERSRCRRQPGGEFRQYDVIDDLPPVVGIGELLRERHRMLSREMVWKRQTAMRQARLGGATSISHVVSCVADVALSGVEGEAVRGPVRRHGGRAGLGRDGRPPLVRCRDRRLVRHGVGDELLEADLLLLLHQYAVVAGVGNSLLLLLHFKRHLATVAIAQRVRRARIRVSTTDVSAGTLGHHRNRLHDVADWRLRTELHGVRVTWPHIHVEPPPIVRLLSHG